MANPTPILDNINAFDATQGTTISFNIIGGTDIVRSNIVYIYDLSTNDLICTHLYISTESIHELPPNTDSSIVYASGKSSADFVNNKNYYLQIQTFTNTAGTAGGSGMSVAKTFWCLFNPALSVNAIPAAISTTSYNVGATYTTNITDVTIPVTNIIQQYKFDLYTATGTLVQTSGNIIGSGEQEGTSTTYNITYNFSGLVVNNSYYVVVTTTSTEGMTVSAQSNTFTVSIDTPTVGGAIVNNNACDGYISVVSNLSDEYGGHVSGEMASFETDSVNNVSSLKVNMEPTQDLHGYDHPWVGGAGKNILNKDKTFTFTTVEGIYFNQPIPTGTRIYVYLTSHTYETEPSEGSKKIAIRFTTAGGADAGAVTLTDGGTASVVLTAEATQGTIYANGYNYAASQGVTTTINELAISKENITAYSPYSNICPISGRDSVEASVTGVNVWDEEWESGAIDGASGGAYTDSTRIRSKNYVSVLPNTVYYVKMPYAFNYAWYDAGKQYISGDNSASPNYARISPNNARYLKFSTAGTTYNHDISINYPSTDHEYHAYTGQSYHQDIEATYTPTVQENEPYQFKRTGDVGGDRESIKLVGGTVAWNQLAPELNASNWRANTTYGTVSYGTNSVTYTSTGKNGNQSINRPNAIGGIPMVQTHKYFLGFNITISQASTHVWVQVMDSQWAAKFSVSANKRTYCASVFSSENATGGNAYFGIFPSFNTGIDVGETFTIDSVNIIDLTALFNPTIADYIYSLEQSQAGAGVAWFRNYFPKDYYPYDKGTLRSVEGVSAHETVGFNQWDGTKNDGYYWSDSGVLSEYAVNSCTNKIRLLPNTTYYFKKPESSSLASITIKFFNEDMHLISKSNIDAESTNRTLTTPNNVEYTIVNYGGAVFPEIFCINLSDPSRNGEYEPYQKHTYPLDSSLTLRGVPKLDASNNLYYDGDIYKSDGTVERRYGIVDLGTLTWKKDTKGDNWSFYTDELMSLAKKASSWDSIPNIKCVKYITVSSTAFFVSFVDKTMNIKTNGQLFIVDKTYNDASAFKTAMSGVYLVYELATPTTETAEPFTNPQVVDNWGTEAYVTTGIVPVGHDTTYLTRDIFGGTLDLVTGVLTVDKKYVLGDTLDWVYVSSGTYFYAVVSDKAKGYNNVTCNIYATAQHAGVANLQNNQIVGGMNDTAVYVKDSRYTNATTFKQAMSETGILYELTTPLTYQLTPHQIQTLVGQNNIWSDAGDVDVTFNLPISNLLVKRQDTSDTSGKWLTLYSQPITQASDMDFTYIDFLNQHGKTYRYALVPLLTQQQGGVDVEIEGGYTVSDDILSVFDGVFIANNNGSQKLKAATEYGDLETNQDVGVLTTIGNKYPFVVSNSNLNYHSGSISALIVPSDFYTSGDLDRLDIVERREAIEQFLTDKTAKILKDWNGNIWLITFVENVEVSFVDDYGMGLGTLSAKWVEIGDVNDQTDLQQTGLI